MELTQGLKQMYRIELKFDDNVIKLENSYTAYEIVNFYKHFVEYGREL